MKPLRQQTIAKQDGMVLVLVLWMIMILTVLAASFTLSSRTENLQSRLEFENTRARYAAEAGLHRAVYELRNPDPESRWVADGRPYTMDLDGISVEIRITDESGKININNANIELLKGLFASVGMEEEDAAALVDAMGDWIDGDDAVRPLGAEDDDYKAAGYPYGAKDAPFDTVQEIQQVMGMTYAIYRQIEPAITVYSRNAGINLATAPLEALRALPDISEEDAQAFIEQRQQAEYGEPLPILPNGQTAVARGGGLAYSVRSKATLPNGHSAELDATIRLGGTVQGKPFQVMRWRDNEHL
jgi:general secretion pathway protein K